MSENMKITQGDGLQRTTLAVALEKLIAEIERLGGPKFEVGAFPHYEGPGDRKIFLDDNREGYYVAVGLAPKDLAAGDSMGMFGNQIRGYVNLSVKLNPFESRMSSELSDEKILELPINPESDEEKFVYASVGFELLKDGKNVMGITIPGLLVKIDAFKNEISEEELIDQNQISM